MGDVIRMRLHGLSAVAARFGPRNFNSTDFDPAAIVPVVPNGIGGVVRPGRPGDVFVYMPLPTFPRFSGDTTRLNAVRVFGFVGKDADYVSTQVLGESTMAPVSEAVAPSGRRLSGEVFSEQIAGSVLARTAIGQFSLAVAMRVAFRNTAASSEHFFTLHGVEVDYEETS